MKRNYLLYLDDILKSIHKIETFRTGYNPPQKNLYMQNEEKQNL